MSKRTLISVIIICLIVGFSIWAYFVSKNLTKDVEKLSHQVQSAENLNVSDLVITETNNGNKYWEVYAEKARYVADKNVTNLSEVAGNFYKDNKVVMSFMAPAAVYEDKKKQIKLLDGAKAVTQDGTIITAKELGWSGKSDKLTAEKNVRIVKEPKFILLGDKTIFTSDMKHINIVGNSQTKVY